MNNTIHICYKCRKFFPADKIVYDKKYGPLCQECSKLVANNKSP